jgi:L-2-hydroxycarboxylate dehydrogenase (NAD+)
MQQAIAKARNAGVGVVTVRNSNHYGIAGYYAMMALENDMIGFSMTNTDVLAVPTFGRDALLGTNPIAVAMPAGAERPYVLDMATTVVPRGKLEVYDRQGKRMPLGWATDERGLATDDPTRVLRNFLSRAGGGLLPLGGEGELLGGHKGYGLSLLVELLCGVLAGAAYMDLVYPKDAAGKPLPANLGHIFGALRVDAFRPLDEYKASMDDAIRRLHNSSKAEGQTRIYIHGEKEFELAERNQAAGVPLEAKVVADLKKIGDEIGVPYTL